jgi:beta-galactosidase/beta-glucuronidase
MNFDLTHTSRPDFRRAIIENLVGLWQFAFDDEDCGLAERWFVGSHNFPLTINVPYPHQAQLSGIGDTNHHKVVWYARKFTIPKSFAGKRVLLHLGAVDYACTVWVNGVEVGQDEGGYLPFCFDITAALRPGENALVVRVFDDPRDAAQPRGKQHPSGEVNRWHYTHITGIWQPVWLEAVAKARIDNFRITPRIAPKGVDMVIKLIGAETGEVGAKVFDGNQLIGEAIAKVTDGIAKLAVDLPNAELWSPEQPNLHDVTLQLSKDGAVVDSVDTYIGLRTVGIKGDQFLLNDKPIWLNMALVQGYWPEGLYVPKNVDDYIRDIEFLQQLGLNGIRMHQKVEDPRFLYLCDKMGLIVWGEMANAGEGCFTERAAQIADRLWERVIDRDYNHPCIVTWVYSNEHWLHDTYDDQATVAHYAAAYDRLKANDSTRPIIDNSGYLHVKTDIMDFHSSDVAAVRDWVENGNFTRNLGPRMVGTEKPYEGQPIIASEWITPRNDFEAADETFYQDYENIVITMAESGLFNGHCYVQLNDIENECNGYLTYDRRWKVDPQRIAAIHARAKQIYEAGH